MWGRERRERPTRVDRDAVDATQCLNATVVVCLCLIAVA